MTRQGTIKTPIKIRVREPSSSSWSRVSPHCARATEGEIMSHSSTFWISTRALQVGRGFLWPLLRRLSCNRMNGVVSSHRLPSDETHKPKQKTMAISRIYTREDKVFFSRTYQNSRQREGFNPRVCFAQKGCCLRVPVAQVIIPDELTSCAGQTLIANTAARSCRTLRGHPKSRSSCALLTA